MTVSNGNFIDEEGNVVNIVQLLRNGEATPIDEDDGHYMRAHSGWYTDENGVPVNLITLLGSGVSGYVTPEMFGAVGDGVTDDTTAVQSAINSSYNYVRFGSEKTYLVGSLTPAENKILDLNYSTIKLKDETELPVFYTINNGTTKKHGFTVMNGFIDCNMSNNHSVNQSAGTFWITGWEQLEFINLKITHAYRNIINLYNCENIYVRNVECKDCGLSGDSRFSYGAAFEPKCKNVVVENFYVHDMYGYGIHFNETENFHAKNCIFDTFTGTNRIGITCTEAKNGVIDNVVCKSISGIGLEINASEQVDIKNVNITSCGGIPITFGNNGTSINNKNIKLDHIITADTGGSYSLSCNYLDDSVISNSNFDKGLTTVINAPSSNIMIRNCYFGQSLMDYHLKQRFKYDSTTFTDFILSLDMKAISIKPAIVESIPVNGRLEIDVSAVKSSSAYLGGVIRCLSYMTTNRQQMSVSECPINIINLAVGTLSKTIGSDYRLPTISVDTSNNKVLLTNANDVPITFVPILELLCIN